MPIVAPPEVKNQEEKMSRQQKRARERQRKKEQAKMKKMTEKKLKKVKNTCKANNMEVRFNNETVSGNALFTFVEAFKKALDIPGIIAKHCWVPSHHNKQYSVPKLIEQAIDALMMGFSRFYHMQHLKCDPGFKLIKETGSIPDESTVRKIFPKMKEPFIQQLLKVNQDIVYTYSKLLSPQSAWVDFDDTVCPVHGGQEKSAVGYNPKYRGRPSYKIKVAVISGLDVLLNIGLYDGKTNSNSEFLPFLEKTLAIARGLKNTVVQGVRMDKGFFDQINFDMLEDQCIDYVCKVPLKKNIKMIIDYIDQEEYWSPLSEAYDTAELTVPLPSWEKERRFVFIREKIKGAENSLFAEEIIEYKYEVIVTNIDTKTPEEIWHCYNKRCDVENRIDELKTGFLLDKNSQNNFFANYGFTVVKAIAYNILQGFKWLLPLEALPFEAPRLRRTFINQPGNIRGNGRYRYISLPTNKWLKKTIMIFKRKFKWFQKHIAKIKASELLYPI